MEFLIHGNSISIECQESCQFTISASFWYLIFYLFAYAECFFDCDHVQTLV